MKYVTILSAVLLSASSGLAMAQALAPTVTGARPGNVIGTGASLPVATTAGNTGAGNVRPGVVPNLPMPAIGPDATSREYLIAARAALVAGRTGEAQQALEMAETRALDRSVVATEAGVPNRDRVVQQIAEAVQALGNKQRDHALELIDGALLP